MQSGLRWSRAHSRRRFPVVSTPYAPPSARRCGCRGTVALVRRCALCAWSVACGQACGVCPAHPCASPLRAGLPVRPPWAAPSAQRLSSWFCYKFSSCSRTEYGGYRPKRPVSQRDRWLTSARGKVRQLPRQRFLGRSASSGHGLLAPRCAV